MSTSPPSSPQWPAIIALVVALGGVPAATAWAFADKITQDPWRAAAVAIVYPLGAFVVGALTELWQRLKAPGSIAPPAGSTKPCAVGSPAITGATNSSSAPQKIRRDTMIWDCKLES